MAEQPLEKTEAYKAGMRDAKVQELENDLKEHQRRCDERADLVWKELRSHTKLIYIGFGVIVALEIVVIVASGFFNFNV